MKIESKEEEEEGRRSEEGDAAQEMPHSIN